MTRDRSRDGRTAAVTATALRFARLTGLLLISVAAGGCAVGSLIGGMMQNHEYQKKIEVLPRYDDLEGRTVAIVVDADMATLFQFPDLVDKITGGVTMRIGRDVPNVSVLLPRDVLAWQWRTMQWNALTYGEIAEQLGVDRVVFIEIYEYRLNPPGNQWLWDGVAAARVSVIERDGFDPDSFADTIDVIAKFPDIEGVDKTGATAYQIEMGLLADFIKRCAWVFHMHEEPKYPDRYRPELETG
jgi:hypothetical protein